MLRRGLGSERRTGPVRDLRRVRLLRRHFPRGVLLCDMCDSGKGAVTKYMVCLSGGMTRIRCVNSSPIKERGKTISFLFCCLARGRFGRIGCFSVNASMRSKKHMLGRKLVFRGRKFKKETIICSACRLPMGE